MNVIFNVVIYNIKVRYYRQLRILLFRNLFHKLPAFSQNKCTFSNIPFIRFGSRISLFILFLVFYAVLYLQSTFAAIYETYFFIHDEFFCFNFRFYKLTEYQILNLVILELIYTNLVKQNIKRERKNILTG